MRFAISALALVSIASAVGTILKQNDPVVAYVNQYGAFWFEVFRALDLNAVYNATWFLVVLAFLLLSTSLCLIRNTPKMIRDMKSWRDRVQRSGLLAIRHGAETMVTSDVDTTAAATQRWLSGRGWSVKRVSKEDGAILVTAKRGMSNRLGYIFTHAAIVIIALGGLLDSDLLLRLQMVFFNKAPIENTASIETVPSSGRLGKNNPSYRGSTLIPEGQSSDLSIVNWRNGTFVQDLPFEIRLNRFIVDYYSTGMPKRFASDVVLTDKEDGTQVPATIEVNHPLTYKGITIYQSSFDDGGSKLSLKAHPMRGPADQSLALDVVVGGSTPLTNGNERLTLEVVGFRAINVEDLSKASSTGQQEVEKSLREHVAAVVSSTATASEGKKLQNVGPSVQYKLRDETGQAVEFHNYMFPVELDGKRMFIAGIRETPNQPFRYLRIPADEKDSLTEFFRIRAALQSPEKRKAAAKAFAMNTALAEGANPELRTQLGLTTEKALDAFSVGGFNNVGLMIEQSVPALEREKAADVVIRMLQGGFWELWKSARADAGLSQIAESDSSADYAQRMLTAISDAFLYNAPLMLQMESFEEIKASVLQVTKTPGKNVVYLGCLLLVIGVFAMLYIHERRAWIWVMQRTDIPGGANVVLAISATRNSLDFEREVTEMKIQFSNVLDGLTKRPQPAQ